MFRESYTYHFRSHDDHYTFLYFLYIVPKGHNTYFFYAYGDVQQLIRDDLFDKYFF